jgi:hypothetical protein
MNLPVTFTRSLLKPSSKRLLFNEPFKRLAVLSLVSFTLLTPSAYAENIGLLYEQAIYSEQTIGDLDKAIQTYQRVLDTNNSSLVAKALYRQAHCYHLLGQKNAAIANLEKIVKQHKAHSIYTKAKKLLQTMYNEAINLLPIPWINGEELSYKVFTAKGKHVAVETLSAKLAVESGREVWKFSRYVGHVSNRQHENVIVDSQTFSPLGSSKRSLKKGFSKTSYSGDGITTTFPENPKHKPNMVIHDAHIYDNQQIRYLIRRLPLTQDYTITQPIFSPEANKAINMKLKVTGKETIEAAKQSFTTYRVKIDFVVNDKVGQSIQMWIADNEQRYILKTETPSTTYLLSEINQRDSGNYATYAIPAQNINFDILADRQAIDVSSVKGMNVKNAFKYLILKPDLSSHFEFVVTKADGQTAKQFLNTLIESQKRNIKSAKIRSLPTNQVTAEGQPVQIEVLDYQSKRAKRTVIYSAFEHQQQLVLIVGLMESKDYDQVNQELTDLIASVTLN